ncbi:MAG: SRPBCC family protein [Pyrinomonadaceae bacterium]|nr:SRPBCC family protein [Acidobacteriota bacterium]MBK7932749.1 SRPBCC family protein [Acidobacteriota bacterium]MBP7374923.1 SRPBCC family protein [Pyrinomonadaceae bacterium]
MPEIFIETQIHAPAEVCFDLMRDVRLHTETISQTHEEAVAGVSVAMIGVGQTVTFEGSHFGMRQRLTVEVTEFERPRLFVDEMIEGRFKSFKHIHEFIRVRSGTLLRDTIIWRSPLGFLGKIVDKLVLERHLRKLVTTRNKKLKQIAESGVFCAENSALVNKITSP